MPQATQNNFVTEGALLFRNAFKGFATELSMALAGLPMEEAGVRIKGNNELKALLVAEGPIGAVAASVLGSSAKPVRAILFNKSATTNWSLGWHQDRTICVKARREMPGFGPWTSKGGMHHVEPPFELLSRMVTLRAHLDDVPATNAPLLYAPGSHALGRIPVKDVHDIVRRYGTKACTAAAGDIWLYATPILHASEAASLPSSRRVLQVDYSAEGLPAGLDWLGI